MDIDKEILNSEAMLSLPWQTTNNQCDDLGKEDWWWNRVQMTEEDSDGAEVA